MGEREAHQQRLLLAGRGAGGRRVLGPVPDREIADVRADQRAAGGGVAAAIVAQERAVAVLGVERRAARDERLDLALERQPRPGKGRGIVALGPDQRLEAAHAFEPRRRDRDAELGRLALDRVEPGGVAPVLVEQPVAPAQSALEGVDPRAMARIDRQNEPIEEAAPLARRPGEQRVHRGRQPDDPDMVAEGARRGDGRAVDPAPALGAAAGFGRAPAGAELAGLAAPPRARPTRRNRRRRRAARIRRVRLAAGRDRARAGTGPRGDWSCRRHSRRIGRPDGRRSSDRAPHRSGNPAASGAAPWGAAARETCRRGWPWPWHVPRPAKAGKRKGRSDEASRRPHACDRHGPGRRPDRRAVPPASPVARARPRGLARRAWPFDPRGRFGRRPWPNRRGAHAPPAQSRDRGELRRRLRPHRRPMGGRARDHRHPYARRARRRGRRRRDGADDHGGAPASAGRALPARRAVADGGLPADRVAARADAGRSRPRPDRQDDRAARRSLRARGRLSRPPRAARRSLSILSVADRHGRGLRHPDGRRARRAGDPAYRERRGSARAWDRRACWSTSPAARWSTSRP